MIAVLGLDGEVLPSPPAFPPPPKPPDPWYELLVAGTLSDAPPPPAKYLHSGLLVAIPPPLGEG